ncbi:hypothetical protein PQR05_29295 [Paraburkholderia sediminicola]|uniref:hypothetical protein n=1 Tax=Paraburkholderia sediminicola TaxID=458836 RepID=UPI0038BCA3D1
MAFTRDDLLAALQTEVQSRPVAAMYYQAGDPRLLAQIGAQATMLSMISAQVDVAGMEGFQKTRDTTVLADATMKGILPFARASRHTLNVVNKSLATVGIVAGRRLLDSYGRVYVAEVGASIPAGASGAITVKQLTTRAFSHIVSGSTAFYPVQIPPNADAEQFISGVYVSIAGQVFPFATEFANLAANDPGFTIETDELRRLFVKFGWANTFGVQPTNGTQIDFVIEETFGETSLGVDSAFSFESTTSDNDRLCTIKLATVIYPGANPVDIETLREWARYPSGYDSSAVYLGNFDFLIRRNLFPMRFLSVWNEQVEESVRGPNVGNINRLFIAATMDAVDPTWMQREIKRIVAAADDSYWVKFVPVKETPLPVTINAQVSVVHDTEAVKAQIQKQMLSLYGRDSKATQQGMLRLNNKRVSDALRTNVIALQDDGSDFQVLLPDQSSPLPEQYRYVSVESLAINVTQATYNDGMWSH